MFYDNCAPGGHGSRRIPDTDDGTVKVTMMPIETVRFVADAYGGLIWNSADTAPAAGKKGRQPKAARHMGGLLPGGSR